jgi:predicted RNA-binding protein associated with RNAse of E/G family
VKRKRLSDTWDCILAKEMQIKEVHTEFFDGYTVFLDMKKVTGPQYWQLRGQDIMVCDTGMKWLSMLPKDDFYCITAMMDQQDNMVLWYIDMIDDHGVDAEGVPWFDDLYLDLVVYADGTIVIDDRDELEDALTSGDVSKEQYMQALETCERLQVGRASGVEKLTEFTRKCLAVSVDTE